MASYWESWKPVLAALQKQSHQKPDQTRQAQDREGQRPWPSKEEKAWNPALKEIPSPSNKYYAP